MDFDDMLGDGGFGEFGEDNDNSQGGPQDL
jgi:hypothetical protein